MKKYLAMVINQVSERYYIKPYPFFICLLLTVFIGVVPFEIFAQKTAKTATTKKAGTISFTKQVLTDELLRKEWP